MGGNWDTGTHRKHQTGNQNSLGHQQAQAITTKDNNYPSNRENPPGSNKNPPFFCKAERNTRYHPKASGDHPQAFGNTRHSGLQWASSPGKNSRNSRKVPHRVTTPAMH